jgi:hypothetical protein
MPTWRWVVARSAHSMVALVWLVIIAVAALLVVRLGTTALTLTGLARPTAEFQAYSAFFGVGFTTRESEQVVNHPVRRRIVQHLILAGHVGLTSVIVPLVVTFVNVKTMRAGMTQLALIVGALAVLWFVVRTSFVENLVERSIKFALQRAGTLAPSPDHEVLLRLDADHTVSEIVLGMGHPFVGRRLGDQTLAEHGIVVLGVGRHDGSHIAAPGGEMICRPFDILTVYGREDEVRKMTTALGGSPRRTSPIRSRAMIRHPFELGRRRRRRSR